MAGSTRTMSPVLKIRDFRLMILARGLILLALQMQALLVGWEVYHLRSNTLLLGFLGLAEAAPAIVCSFFSGHVVDHHRPSMIYRLSLATLCLNATVLFVATLPSTPLSADQRLVFLFTAVFVSGIVRSFVVPSSFALLPHIVPRPLFSTAAAWSTSAYQFAAILGPILGGFAYGWLGSGVAFALLPVFSLLGFIAATAWSPSTKSYKSDHPREPFSTSMQVGLRFVLRQKVMLSAMALDMFSVLFGGAVQILPAYAAQILMVGPVGLGLLRAAPSVGSLLVVLRLAIKPMRVISGVALLTVVAGFGLSIIGFALSTNFILSVIFLGLSGAFDGVSMVIRQTILQLLTPDNVRGRVSAVSTVFITSSNEIGGFESGLAATLMGLVPSVVFGGLMTLVVVTITALVSPEFRRTRISQ